MASGTATFNKQTTPTQQTGFFDGKRGRLLRENLTAYLFLFPAMSLIFIFGLFPVIFSIYVSLYKWQIKQGAFRGLGNYTRAMDNLTYLVAFGLAIGAIWLAIKLLIKIWKTAKENNNMPWLFAIPGVLLALALYQFIKFSVAVLPGILEIGEKVQRLEKTRELYIQLFSEAFQVEAAVQARLYLMLLLVAAVLLWIGINRFIHSKHHAQYVNWFFLATSFGLLGVILGQFTYSSIITEYTKAAEKGTELNIWPQLILLSSGFILLYLSWRLWQKASQQENAIKMILGMVAAVMLLAGGWILVAELPPILEAGDKSLWSGLAVTAWFSLGTVPIQLMLGLFIAYLLYQDIKGKSFFRMIYFLPYITPAVASAAVFRVIFSNRPSGMMNSFWTFFGAEPLNWLLEPKGIFTLLFASEGIEGPSLALVVIMLFNIWTYSGYNAVIFLAGLGGIPTSLYEAAEIDGANRWQSFRHVTLPLLSPITYFLSLLGVIGTFKAFNHIFVLRNPAALRTVDTMSMVIWDLLKVDNRYGYGATMAFVLFGVVLILTVINNAVQGKRVFYG